MNELYGFEPHGFVEAYSEPESHGFESHLTPALNMYIYIYVLTYLFTYIPPMYS